VPVIVAADASDARKATELAKPIILLSAMTAAPFQCAMSGESVHGGRRT
jgi:hypothetical protein